MSALGNVYPVGGFPFDSAKHDSWRNPIPSLHNGYFGAD